MIDRVSLVPLPLSLKKEVQPMSEHKNSCELAADITIAAMGVNSSLINRPEIVAKFYRAIYKEIVTCDCTPIQDLD